jgi:CheY-like chemotaxis protein
MLAPGATPFSIDTRASWKLLAIRRRPDPDCRRTLAFECCRSSLVGAGCAKAFHILVVDDDRATRETISELLRDRGYDVTVAANGEQALMVCRSQSNPDLILLDLQMPVMDGIEFTRQKNNDPELSHVPVCVMTSFRDSVPIPRGVSVVLRKPLGSTDLISVARRFAQPDSARGPSPNERKPF